MTAAASLAGCLDHSDLGVTDQATVMVDTATSVDRVDDCEPWHCGGNGGLGADLPFHELHARGWPNEAQLSIVRFDGPRADPTDPSSLRKPLHLDVIGRDLLGTLPSGDVLKRERLEDARLILKQPTLDPITQVTIYKNWILEIRNVSSVGFWVGPNPGDRVPVYEFYFGPEGTSPTDFIPLCPERGDELPGLRGMAVVFEGDRYDAHRKTAYQQLWREPDDTWFNFSCATTATAKMLLLRQATAGSDVTHHSSFAERTAMVKMLTGDYCGTGHTYTIDNQPIRYLTHQGWYIEQLGAPDIWNSDAMLVDALWSEDGAVCVDWPRLMFRPGFELIFNEIDADCGGRVIPWCASYRPTWQDDAYVVSASNRPDWWWY